MTREPCRARRAAVGTARATLAVLTCAPAVLAVLTASCTAPTPPSGAPGTSRPRVSDAAAGTEVVSNDGHWVLRITPAIERLPLNEPFEIDVRVARSAADGEPPEGVTLAIDAAMPEHQHGMTVAPRVTRTGPHSWHVDGMLLHMSGEWELYLDVTDGPLTERAQVRLDLK